MLMLVITLAKNNTFSFSVYGSYDIRTSKSKNNLNLVMPRSWTPGVSQKDAHNNIIFADYGRGTY